MPAEERYAFNMDHTQVPLFTEKELRKALGASRVEVIPQAVKGAESS